nr:RHS repeat-associated core domain-containing protein [Candidatus Electrothrix aestuarii]
MNQSETASPVVAEASTPSDTAFLQAIYFLLLLNHKSAEGAYYYINDHLGTPQIITNDSGSVVWKAEYLPFGKVNISVADIENNLRFPGQYYDAETGLHYNWNRYYDPETGRYIAADPIGLGGGMNLYAYVGSDPVNAVDPMGLMDATWGQVGTFTTGLVLALTPEGVTTAAGLTMMAGVLATIPGDTPISPGDTPISKPSPPPGPCNSDKCTCTSDITITDLAAGTTFSIGKASASASTCKKAQDKLFLYAQMYAAYKRARNGTGYKAKHINKTHCVKH